MPNVSQPLPRAGFARPDLLSRFKWWRGHGIRKVQNLVSIRRRQIHRPPPNKFAIRATSALGSAPGLLAVPTVGFGVALGLLSFSSATSGLIVMYVPRCDHDAFVSFCSQSPFARRPHRTVLRERGRSNRW